MRHPLTRREQSVLRRLAVQIRDEDPELADQLERPSIPAAARFSPLRWSPSVYLAIGIAFLAIGVLLDVGSATMGGLVSISVAVARSRSARQLLLKAAAGYEAGFKRPLG